MKNLTITHQIYEKTSNRGGYRAMRAELDGQFVAASVANPQVVDFIEGAIGDTINRAIVNTESAIDITVHLPDGITLPAESIAKYEADPIVNSITVS